MVKNSVGLDIGTTAIKIVELKRVGKRAQLVRAKIVETPPDLAEQKRVISKLLSDFRVRRKALSVAVSGLSAYVRYITLPPLDVSRIEQMMNYEARQQIPVPLEEVVWDYRVLPAKDLSKTSIVLVAAKLDAIKKLLETIRRGGIEPYLIDYAPFASYNALRLSGSIDTETSVFVDIGAESTNLSIETGGSLCWTRSLPVGGISLTTSIKKALGVTYEEAEKLKKEKGGAPGSEGEPGIVEAMAPSLRHLADEIERSLTFFQTELGGGSVEQLTLSGGAALTKGITTFLESHLGTKVVLGTPLRALLLPTPFISGDKEAFFATAIGLALRPLFKCPIETNLLPLNILKKREFRAKRVYLVVSFILALLTAGVFSEFFRQDYRITRSHIAIIEADLKKYTEREPEMRKAEEEKLLAIERVKALRELAIKRISVPGLLLELTQLLPDEIYLKSFSFKEEELKISGVAPSLPIITDFREKIEASPLLGPTTTELGGEPGAHEFTFAIELKGEAQ